MSQKFKVVSTWINICDRKTTTFMHEQTNRNMVICDHEFKETDNTDYTYACMHARTHALACTHTHTHTHTQSQMLNTHTNTRQMYLHLHTHILSLIHPCMHIRTYSHMSAQTHTQTHMHAHTCMHAHTHTHTHNVHLETQANPFTTDPWRSTPGQRWHQVESFHTCDHGKRGDDPRSPASFPCSPSVSPALHSPSWMLPCGKSEAARKRTVSTVVSRSGNANKNKTLQGTLTFSQNCISVYSTLTKVLNQ